MQRSLTAALSVVCLLMAASSVLRAEYPKPSLYPTAWEFKFQHDAPKRVVVQVPRQQCPQGLLVHDLRRDQHDRPGADVPAVL